MTPRNVIACALVVAALSLFAMMVDFALPPDSGGLGADSYGTHADGYLALMETLQRLNVSADRSLVPPTAFLGRDVCLVFLSPSQQFVDAEPGYLQKVGKWVRNGGRVVYVSPHNRESSPYAVARSHFEASRNFLAEMGLTTVTMKAATEEAETTHTFPLNTARHGGRDSLQESPGLSIFGKKPGELQSVPARADGALASMDSRVRLLRLCKDELSVLETTGSLRATGRVYLPGPGGRDRTVAALFSHGAGEIAVVSDSIMATNAAISAGDNATLFVDLIRRSGRPVVFDEFYHGLSIRGNPFWLLTRYPYGIVAFMLAFASALWVWRAAVALGPPLPDPIKRRRSLSEYLDAMGNLFSGRRRRQFVIREIRDGCLFVLRKEMQLDLKHEDEAAIIAAVSRKDRERAERLRESLGELDEMIRRVSVPSESEITKAARKATQCL